MGIKFFIQQLGEYSNLSQGSPIDLIFLIHHIDAYYEKIVVLEGKELIRPFHLRGRKMYVVHEFRDKHFSYQLLMNVLHPVEVDIVSSCLPASL